MKRIVFSAVLFLFALALHAQRVSGQFNNVSMADALQQLSSQTDDYVVRTARDELGMIMPDEVRYVNGAR